MHWHPGAGHFSLWILCLVISWAPSQEAPLLNETLESMNQIINQLHDPVKALYEFYKTAESLPDRARPLVSYGPELSLSAFQGNGSTFLRQLRKIKEFKELPSDSDFHNNISNVILQLENLIAKSETATIPPLPEDTNGTMAPLLEKYFVLDTFREFSHFIAYLCEPLQDERLGRGKCACKALTTL